MSHVCFFMQIFLSIHVSVLCIHFFFCLYSLLDLCRSCFLSVLICLSMSARMYAFMTYHEVMQTEINENMQTHTVCTCMHTHRDTHNHLHTYMHSCVRPSIHLCMYAAANIHACMHTYIHTYIHTYVHLHTLKQLQRHLPL